MMRWRDTRTPYDVTVAGLTSRGSAVFYGVDCPMINKPTFYPRYLCLLFFIDCQHTMDIVFQDKIVFCRPQVTDYGRPMKPFFIEIQNFWAWADKL